MTSFPSHLTAHFKADLIENLQTLNARNYHYYTLEAFVNMPDSEYLSFMKKRMRNSRDFYDWKGLNDLTDKSACLKANAQELLRIAVETDQTDIIRELVTNYKANPQTVFDGKTLLFYATKWETVHFLLERYYCSAFKIDPLHEFDGLKFFERDEFLSNEIELRVEQLISLFKQGLDLFSSGKSGFSFFDRLNPKAQLVIPYEGSKFKFPAAKLSKQLFELCAQKELDVLQKIDEDGNTVLHYIANSGAYDKQLPISTLKQTVNRIGVSVYSILLETDKNFVYGCLFEAEHEFSAYLNDYIALYETDVFKKHGEILLLFALKKPNFCFATYLQDEHQVSLDAIVFTQNAYPSRFDTLIKSIASEKTFLFLMKNGWKPALGSPCEWENEESLNYFG